MKIFVTVIGLWLVWLAPMAFGEEVKRETAQTVAKNWYAHCKGTRGAQISRTVTGEYAGRITRYTFAFKGGGFVIVSGDDIARPIIGYSLTAPVKENITNEALHAWLTARDKEIAKAAARGGDSSNRRLWDDILNKRFPTPAKSRYATAIAPLVTTAWNQNAFYNELCPGRRQWPR